MADLVGELQRLELSAQDIRQMVDWPDPLIEDYLSIIRNLVLLAEQLVAVSASAEEGASAVERTASLMRQLNKFINDTQQERAEGPHLQAIINTVKARETSVEELLAATEAEIGRLRGQFGKFSTNLSRLTDAEVSQLENINTTTISTTQWGYVGAFDQGLSTSDSVNFAGVSIGGDALSDQLPNLTDAEVNQLETIGTTTISAGQWGILGGLSGTLTSAEVNVLDGAAVTTAELQQVANIDSETISNAQWGFLGAMGAQPLEPGDTLIGAAGSEASPGIRFSGDTNTGLFHPAADTLAWSLGGSEAMRFDGSLYIGETANANMTQGLTINQGGADDEIVAFKSSDIDHGITSETETDTYGYIQKQGAGYGVLQVTGLSETGIKNGIHLRAIADTADTTPSTSATGNMLFDAMSFSGTGLADLSANALAYTFRARRGGSLQTIVAFDEDGDIHVDGSGTLNTFDGHDDVDLLEGLRADLLGPDRAAKNGLGEKVGLYRNVLESRGVVTYNDSDGRHFVSMKGLSALQTDAMRQMKAMIKDQEARLSALEDAQ